MRRRAVLVGLGIVGAAVAALVATRALKASDHQLAVAWQYDGDAVDPYHLDIVASNATSDDYRIHTTVVDANGAIVRDDLVECFNGYAPDDTQRLEVALTRFLSGSQFTIQSDFLALDGSVNASVSTNFTKP